MSASSIDETVVAIDAEPEVADTVAEVSRAQEPATANEPRKTPPLSRLTAVIVRRRTPILISGLAVLAVAALVAAGVLGGQLRGERAVDAAAREALAAARSYAVTLTSVDANHLERDFDAILDGATGEFKDLYSRSSGQLRQLLVENKASGTGTVLDAGVKSATVDKVEVVLFIDQTVTNTASPDPRVDRSRVSMTMEREGGRWLASRVYLP